MGGLIDKIPAVKQLSAADWYQVLSCTFRAGRRMHASCLGIPGMQQLDATQLGELLHACLGCLQKQQVTDVRGLLALPAADHLPAATIDSLMQKLLQTVRATAPVPENGHIGAFWAALLGLPAVQFLPVQAVQQLYDMAIVQGLTGLVNMLLSSLPQQAEQVSRATGVLLVQGMHAALRRFTVGGDLMYWDQEPGLQSLETSSCVQLVLDLLQLSSRVGSIGHLNISTMKEMGVQLLKLLRTLLQLPACQHMQAADVVSIIKACLSPAWDNECVNVMERMISKTGQGNLDHIAQSFEGCWCHPHCAMLTLIYVSMLPAAAAITAEQLTELLFKACQALPSVCVYEVLMQLPAARQMVPAQVAAVLRRVLDGSNAVDMRMHAGYDVGGVVGVLFKHLGQQLGSDEVAALLVYLVQQPPRAGLLAVAGQLLQHPAGQQLSSDALAHLVQVTVWQQEFGGLACMCLQHPKAASMTADGAYSVLEVLAGRGESFEFVSQVLLVPAAQQLSLPQIRSLLWRACQYGNQGMCAALCSLPAAAAARDDPELQVAMAAAEQPGFVDVDIEFEGHFGREWCACPSCRQL
jgi:hypothetical protein